VEVADQRGLDDAPVSRLLFTPLSIRNRHPAVHRFFSPHAGRARRSGGV
jgi:hypothetical protein